MNVYVYVVCFFFFMLYLFILDFFFFFQAEDGIRDADVTGVQTCALPISWDNGEVDGDDEAEWVEREVTMVYREMGARASGGAPAPVGMLVSGTRYQLTALYHSAKGDAMSSFNLPDEPDDYTDRTSELAHAAALLDVDDLISDTLETIAGEWRQNPLAFAASTLKLTCPDPDFMTALPAHAESVGRYVLGVLCERYGKA